MVQTSVYTYISYCLERYIHSAKHYQDKTRSTHAFESKKFCGKFSSFIPLHLMHVYGEILANSRTVTSGQYFLQYSYIWYFIDLFLFVNKESPSYGYSYLRFEQHHLAI